MDHRLIMNTENLQKRFPEVYEEFFSQNNLIVSCPQIINRGHITHLDAIMKLRWLDAGDYLSDITNSSRAIIDIARAILLIYISRYTYKFKRIHKQK